VSTAPLVLIDLSSIAHPLYHQSGSEPDPNWTSIQTVAKVRALASGQPHVAVCVDGPRSRAIRVAIDPTYKAQRDTAPEALFHQIKLAIETLRVDGFPVWEAEGYEADDVIASAVTKTLSAATFGTQETQVLIISADKDLCQLVGPRVTLKHALRGDVLDDAAVIAKFGVRPDQIGDYLALVGDASDNIKGARGIGPKRAAELLTQHGTLAAIMATGGAGMTPAVRDSLVEFSSRCDIVRSLIALRTEVPVPIEEAFAPRVAKETEMVEMDYAAENHGADMASADSESGTVTAERPARLDVQIEPQVMEQQRREAVARETAMLSVVPVAFEQQLEPRSFGDAWTLAKAMHASRLFSAYGTPEAVLSTILAGRELGLQAMASLRAFHVIEGRPTLSAGIIQALVLKSPHCRYFRCTERTNERATFVTKRGDDPEMALTFTLEDAKLAWSKGEDAFKKSGYGKNPADMCVARAATKLARLVYADVVNNLYAPEEFA
jgi:5'-3' exonuclease